MLPRHQHPPRGALGWTLSAITADMLADAVEAKDAQSERSTQPLA
ncbi:hypothetical protein [Halomonas llamarensis]|nr:hypothetical protein [Halomonas llamarensis]